MTHFLFYFRNYYFKKHIEYNIEKLPINIKINLKKKVFFLFFFSNSTY